MDTIYITEEKISVPEGKQSNVQDVLKQVGLAALISSKSLPIKVIGAIALASPYVFDFLTTKKEINPEEAKRVAEKLNKFVLTLDEIKDNKYKFTPGHPVVGFLYRKHPLSSLDVEKENLYIPEEYYSSLLLQERESEFIKLLVDLGAKKITITKLLNNEDHKASKVNLNHKVNNKDSDGLSNAVTHNVALNVDLNQTNKESTIRVFELQGKKWNINDRVNVNSYHWLKFEPQWQSIVYAREVGHCLKSTIDISSETAFSLSIDFKNSLQFDLSVLGLGKKGESSTVFELEKNRNINNTYRYDIDFLDVK